MSSHREMRYARVYIGRLSSKIRERDVERFFRGYGRLIDVTLKSGFGFIDFEDYRDAKDAVYDLNNRDLLGSKVLLEHAKNSPYMSNPNNINSRHHNSFDYSPVHSHRSEFRRQRPAWYGPPTRTNYRLYVENLSSKVSWQDLKDFMRQCGEVTYGDAHRKVKNQGIIEFATLHDLETALKKLDGTELYGRKIRLISDYKKSASRSYSRSRSRSRSHMRKYKRSRSTSSRRRSATPRRRRRRKSRSTDYSSDSRSCSRSSSRRHRSKHSLRSTSKSPKERSPVKKNKRCSRSNSDSRDSMSPGAKFPKDNDTNHQSNESKKPDAFEELETNPKMSKSNSLTNISAHSGDERHEKRALSLDMPQQINKISQNI